MNIVMICLGLSLAMLFILGAGFHGSEKLKRALLSVLFVSGCVVALAWPLLWNCDSHTVV